MRFMPSLAAAYAPDPLCRPPVRRAGLAGYARPVSLGWISVLPGGLGIIEATMIALYSGLGVPATVVVLVALSHRLLSFWPLTSNRLR
jgi:hypothetical protein